MALKSETLEQVKLFDWIRLQPKIRGCAFSIPNEGKRTPVMCSILKRMGMMPGASDVFIAYPNGVYNGFFIELKAKDKAGRYRKPTDLQVAFIFEMKKMGYQAMVCNGADHAITAIGEYLQ